MISMIIPTLNAELHISKLLDNLNMQTVKIDEIIIVDSESEDNTVSICEKYNNVRVIVIKRSEFDHGKTRDMALRECKGDFVLFMTQDALPRNEHYIENLLKPFENENVALVSGRQIARDDASYAEKLIREFNYPAESTVRTFADLPKYGIKTYFCSDVCSAYRRHVYEKVGGFIFPLRTNEDMFYAATVLRAGYSVAYSSDATVIHSHNLTLREQYNRNCSLGYELEKHKSLLGDVSATGEGMKLVKYVSKGLLSKGRIFSFARFGFDCVVRLLGNKSGKSMFKSQGVE